MSNSNKSLKINNNKYLIEGNKFYEMKLNVIGSSLIHSSGFNKDYIEYSIRVKTNYGKWSFKKRYEEFNKLNNSLLKKIPEIKHFPPKRLFKNSESIIKERIKYFNKYLKFLVDKINIFSFIEIINFLYIEKGIIGLIMKKYAMLKINEENYIYSALKEAFNNKNIEDEDEKETKISYEAIPNEDIIQILNNDNYYTALLEYEKKRQVSFEWDEPPAVTPSTFVIREFLYNLSEKIENKVDIIQTFEAFLQKQEKWIKFSKNDITELFIGYKEEENEEIKPAENDPAKFSVFKLFDKKKNKNENDEERERNNIIPGLFQQIGDYNKNVFSAMGCLDLLEKLLNTEYNPDYEIYISIFKNFQINQYSCMKLNNIIKNNIGGNKANLKAMRLLYLIFGDKKLDKYEKEIIIDDSVYKLYINFVKNFSE